MPSSRTWPNLSSPDLALEGEQLVELRGALVHDAEPAEPFAFVRAGPERGVARPEPADLALRAPVLQRRVHLFRFVLRQGGLHAREPVAEHGGALGGDRAEELVGRVGEEAHAVHHQAVGDAVEVEAEPVQRGQHLARLVHALRQRGPQPAVVAEGVHGRGRHGVHRVRADQLLHVHHVAVGLVLHAGAGPEQALRQGAPERLPAGAGDQLLVAGRRRAWRWRSPRGRAAAAAPPRLVGAGARGEPLVDLLVDHGVDAADEEAGDAGDPRDVLPGLHALLKPGDEGVGHRGVGAAREQQGDVDVQAVGDQPADGRHARFGRRAP